MKMPGEGLLEKMSTAIAHNGIGGLFRPWQMRREGRASIELKREELLAIAQAEFDAERIRRGEIRLQDLTNPRLIETSPAGRESCAEQEGPTLPLRVSETLITEVVRRETNVTRALLHAEQALERESQEPPDAEVDQDWLFRWRDSASQVSNEALQNLWGRVLAGEFKAPGSFSLRTLEFLKNLSQTEAEAIAKLSRFVVSGFIFRNANALLEDEGVTVGFLLKMQQLGVISGVDAMGLTVTCSSIDDSKFVLPLLSNSMAIVATHQDASKLLTLPVYDLTFVGEEVLRLGTFEPHIQYLEKIGEHLKKQGAKVRLARYRDVGEGNLKFFDGREL